MPDRSRSRCHRQMLRRSLAWQSRQELRKERREAFWRARIYGLQARYVYKQMRLDTDEFLREHGLMPPLPTPDTPTRHKPEPAASSPQQQARAVTSPARQPARHTAPGRPAANAWRHIEHPKVDAR